MRYFKLTNEFENHNGFQYKDGLNVDILPFNNDRTESCGVGGLYFSDEKNICFFVDHGFWIREVEIPKGETQFLKDPSGDKYRSHSLFLKERKLLKDVKTWEFLVNCNVDIHAYNYLSLSWAAKRGYLDIVKFLINNGAYIHAENDESLRNAVEYNRFEIVKYLVENGADIHAENDEILECAVEYGYHELTGFLTKLKW